MPIRMTLLVLMTLVACSGKEESATVAGPPILVDPTRIESTLRGYVDRGELVGVSALVYERGDEAYFGTFGLADREAGRPLQRESLVQIYSMTKPMTGVVLMSLYEQGKFELDEPLATYLPEYAGIKVFVGNAHDEELLEEAIRPPTVRDILRHTAGFGNGEAPGWLGERYREVDPTNIENTLEQMSMKLASIPLLFQPGTRWYYGPSVDVQARLIEVLSGKAFEVMLQERVLDPLSLANTQFTLRADQRDRITASYERSSDGTFSRTPDEQSLAFNSSNWPMKPGSWGLTSTLDDYMRFARMLLNGGELDGVRILQADTIRLMATDALPDTVTDRLWLPNKGQVGFGIDFAVRVAPPAHQAEASGAVGEFYWDGAANTLFWVDPLNDIAAVLFLYYRPFGKTEIQKDFRDAIYYRDETASALNKPSAPPGARRLSD